MINRTNEVKEAIKLATGLHVGLVRLILESMINYLKGHERYNDPTNKFNDQDILEYIIPFRRVVLVRSYES